MSGCIFFELTEDGLGGTKGTALGESEIGPVGIGVGVVNDGDKESKLEVVSEGPRQGRIKWSIEPFLYRSIWPSTRKVRLRWCCRMPL